jgi:hypothetical protein
MGIQAREGVRRGNVVIPQEPTLCYIVVQNFLTFAIYLAGSRANATGLRGLFLERALSVKLRVTPRSIRRHPGLGAWPSLSWRFRSGRGYDAGRPGFFAHPQA